ncbi:hypothetical protein V6N11_050176 [Hibiscus sabdariffa]|uniref:F-box domain-containing protein n=1 Tax=Hibiscus sabdariffa TaxID=183260 RepID=A0ABR2T9Z8_9ROSI
MNFSLNWHYSLVTYRFCHIEDALKHDSKATNEVVWLDAKRESKVTNMVEEYVEIISDKILEDELAEKFGGGIQSRKFGIEIMRSDRVALKVYSSFNFKFSNPWGQGSFGVEGNVITQCDVRGEIRMALRLKRNIGMHTKMVSYSTSTGACNYAKIFDPGGSFIVTTTMTVVVQQCTRGEFQRIEYIGTSTQHKKIEYARNLSDSILSHILSSLPIKDAVSTSILSTRWRHLYAYMGRIEQFRLNLINILRISDSHVCGWISVALWRGVKDIDLVFGRWPSHFTMLPTALLFTSMSLVRLKLGFPYVMVVPIHVCLPCLNTLVLQSVVFEDDGSVTRLLSSLVYFKYLGFIANNYSMGNMPSLVTADINISFRNIVREIINHGQCLVGLFEGLGNLKSRNGELSKMNTWKGKGIFEFLEFSPNLQTLVTFKVSKEVWFPMEEVPSCVVYQLKGFKVLDFDDESSLFEMVTYILNNAIALDKLTISTS